VTALVDAAARMAPGHGRKRMAMLRRWVLVVTASVMTACTTPGPADYPLAVQLADLRFAEAGLLEQSIGLDLRFTNPNPEPIRAEGLRFVMELDGRRFGTGVSDAAFEIPRLGEAVVPVTIRVQTGELINRLLALRAGELDYRITGDLFQSTGLASRPLAFSGDSSIVVPDLPGILGDLQRGPGPAR
jgi:LEA14-like dessication related protein